MSTRSQRGRSVQQKQRRSPLPVFYIILAVVAIVGVAAIGTLALRNRQQVRAPAGALVNRAPLNAPIGKTDQGYYYKGKPDAPVTVVEYSDYQCPFCARFAGTTELEIDRDYVETGKIKYVFHDYPLRQHGNAIPAAEATRCAGDQNAFWPMHDMVFANQTQWEKSTQAITQFSTYAEQLKLDRATFETCMTSGKYTAAIAQAQQEGNQVQIPGTPTFIIDGKQLNADELRGAIDAALAAKK